MSADPLTQERREEARRAVRAHLAERFPVACHPNDVRRRLNAGHANDYSQDEIVAAAEFLISIGQVQSIPEALGATLYYRATGEGILAHERGT